MHYRVSFCLDVVDDKGVRGAPTVKPFGSVDGVKGVEGESRTATMITGVECNGRACLGLFFDER